MEDLQRQHKYGGEHVADIIQHRGITQVFTLCGGHISPISIACSQRNIEVIDVRHEVNAVFAADAMARMTGIPGVAIVTAGPGVTNALTALKNASMAQSPLVLIGGATATILRNKGALQDIDQIAVVEPHVKWAVRVTRVSDIPRVLDHAFKEAQDGVPGPVFIELPIDVLYPEHIVRKWYFDSLPPLDKRTLKHKLFAFYLKGHLWWQFKSRKTYIPKAKRKPQTPTYSQRQIQMVAKAIQKAKKPIVLLGSQMLLQCVECHEVNKALQGLQMPIYLSGMARGLLGRNNELLLRHHRRKALKEADVVILAGVPMDFRLGYGMGINANATLISVNRSNHDLYLNRTPKIPIHADPGLFIAALSQALQVNSEKWDDWLKILRERDAKRDDEINQYALEQISEGLNPLWFLQILEQQLDDDTIFIGDGGDFVGSASYVIKARSPHGWLDPGAFGTLGVGAGFAMAAARAKPDKQVCILYGDGSVGYSLSEFDTFVRHKIPVIAVVGNDGAWSQIAREQKEIFGNDVATVIGQLDYHKVVEGFGALGILVKEKNEVQPAIEQAKQAVRKGQPVLINVMIGKSDFRKGSISV